VALRPFDARSSAETLPRGRGVATTTRFEPPFNNLHHVQFGMIECVSAGLKEQFPWLRRNKVKFLIGLCLVQFLCAIPMVMQSGIYWVTLVDWYCSGLPLMVAAGCEIFCIAWIYGVDRFMYDLKVMIGYTPNTAPWWRIAWLYITPSIIVGLVICYMVFYTPVVYDSVIYPSWAEVIGWMSCFSSIILIPATALYQVYYHERAQGLSFTQRVRELLRCDPSWGPTDPEIDYKYRRHGDSGEKLEMLPAKKIGSHGNLCCPRAGDSVGSGNSSPPLYR